MADSAADTGIDPQKRRSTRIAQAVPITVTGVDALGRSFQERTSTIAVNCHGCRYQSKHYVLKNMWVTLEVPHSDPHHPPRSVRARVTWIQRPRTVRELFQVAAELESPGNLWGIAFPQPDWFPFSESVGPAVSAAKTPAQISAPDSATAPPVDNLRVLPIAAPHEAAPALEQQMTGMIEQAKQELREMVRESAAHNAAAETGELLASMQKQLEQAAERSVQTIAEAAAKRAVQESLGRTALKTQEHLKMLQRRWAEDLQTASQQAKSDLLVQISDAAQEQQLALTRQVETFLQQARAQMAGAFEDAEAGLAHSRESLSDVNRQAGAVTAAALEDMEKRLRAHVEQTQTGWHNRLHADLIAATELWDQRIESSLESAAQKSAERLARHSQATAERLENELGSRISSLGKVFVEAMGEAETKLGALRISVQGETARAQGALQQMQSAALGIEDQTARFDALTRNALQELQRRAATVLEAQSRDLARRAETALTSCTQRLEPALEVAAQQAVARLAPQLDEDLAARMRPANETYARLERGVAASEEALHRQQDILNRTADQTVEIARGRLQETLDRMSREIEEAGRVSSTKWLAELDTRATETTHNTFESLFKTSEWYEKKVQQQMQAALEKGLEQASAGLREKAGEISRLFASELDHYNRSYVEHAQGQMEEASREAFERARNQSAEMAAESMTALTRQAEARAQAAVAGVNAQAAAELAQMADQAATQFADTQAQIGEEGRRLSTEFRNALASDHQDTLAAARRDLSALADSSIGELRGEARSQQAQLAASIAATSEQAIQEYRKRLEAASSSWLLTTVSRLDQQSQQLIQSIAQSAQEHVRAACARAFAEVGESLRSHTSDPSAPPTAKGAAASST